MIKDWSWGTILLGMIALFNMLSSVNATTWKMPSDLVCPDPTITNEQNRWFVFCTGPGIQVLTSVDGHNWQRLKPVFPKGLPWWNREISQHNDTNVWAPDLSTFNGKTYLYYSISTSGSRTSAIGLAVADSLHIHNWKDHGIVIKTTNEGNNYNAIDPNLILDKKGKPWLLFGSFFDGIKITPLNPKTMKPASNKLYSVARREGGVEGAILTYHGNYWYLFASIDHCCKGLESNYKIVVSRAKKITGPFIDASGVNALDGGGTIVYAGDGNEIIAPGGQDVFNNNVIAYHYYNKHVDQRTLRINDLYWKDDGWPTF
ncbi:protein AbnA [Phascolomyces articulosus]|uniref:Arabinan endo-1,5-alpha-L-arabinosidase n=1 Tax=Phascolomyces articulosus TaxID=60185 RepID=A0AAD5JPS0_9FUNG|nr:protein AbnA [Phascolomyces articulosus]